jgi:hypothetical protein
MSVNATTAPRPSCISSGADTYETGNIDPSRRQNQSRSTVTGSPLSSGRRIGQSAAGYDVPSGRLWCIVS